MRSFHGVARMKAVEFLKNYSYLFPEIGKEEYKYKTTEEIKTMIKDVVSSDNILDDVRHQAEIIDRILNKHC